MALVKKSSKRKPLQIRVGKYPKGRGLDTYRYVVINGIRYTLFKKHSRKGLAEAEANKWDGNAAKKFARGISYVGMTDQEKEKMIRGYSKKPMRAVLTTDGWYTVQTSPNPDFQVKHHETLMREQIGIDDPVVTVKEARAMKGSGGARLSQRSLDRS